MTPKTVVKGSGEMFDAIAVPYDRMNRILSLGLDQRWRKATVKALGLDRGMRALDVATGTADLALKMAEMCPDVEIVGVDPSRKMLEIGADKLSKRGLGERVRLTFGQAEQLPFGPQEFDCAAIAFGVRNIPDRLLALREMVRVVRPGGRIAILELTEPRGGLLRKLAQLHIRWIVPLIGGLVGHADEYRYLEQSIARFPEASVFEKMMGEAGIQVVARRRFVLGAVTLFVGVAGHGQAGAVPSR